MLASVKPSAVLFDLDGTLLDTLGDIADAMNAVLKERGHPVHGAGAYKLFVGGGMRKLVERALSPGSEAEVPEALEAMRSEYGRRWKDKTRPYPGVESLLDALAARRVPAAVLSNKPHETTLLAVREFLGCWPFAEIRGAAPGGPLKPDPAGALAIAEAMRIPPGAFLYLGDTGTDIETAKRAGMRPIGALWGFRDREELEAAGAEALLDKPEDLLGLL